MKKNLLSKIICILISLTFIFSCVSCKDNKDSENDDKKNPNVDLTRGYNYSKESSGLMQFYSSDAELNVFLNEYMERHLRYNNNSIGDLKIGQGNSIWKEWESMAVMFMNTAELGYDPKGTIKSWISNIYQDEFGYIWMDNGTGSSDWGQCWEFPSSKQSQGHSNNYTFNSSTQGWTAFSDTGAIGSIEAYGSTTDNKKYDGFYKVTDNDMKSVTYQTTDSINFMCDTYHAPLLELNLNVTDLDSAGKTGQIQDIIVSFKTSDDTDYVEYKKVNYSEFSTTQYGEAFPSTACVSFPMSINEYWSDNQTVTGMKIEIIFKNGFNGEVALNNVDLTYDARQINNNGVFIVTAANYFEYTQDIDFLKENIDKIRKAMQFYLTYCNGNSGLVSTENFAGHDGSTNENFINRVSGTTTGTGSGIGDGYWDCLSYPQISSYCNNLYYLSLQKMFYLEQMVESSNSDTANDVSVKTADMQYNDKYSMDSSKLATLLDLSKTKYNTTFWNAKTGRYYLGVNADGKKIDYGFTMFNEEAIQYGLADEAKAESIMSWINGERTVSTDTAIENNIYYYEFAPRWTTVRNEYQFWWQFNGKSGTYYKWGNQIQNGGVAIHQAYYDLTATAVANGIDEAYAKLANIKKWYNKVKDLGKGTSKDFYKAYYGGYLTGNTYRLQGTLGAGAIGLDAEFLEAAILYTSIPDIYFGLGSTKYQTLDITPNLPSELSYWKMENLTFSNLIYDLSIGANFVQINSIQGNNEGLKVKVTLNKPDGGFEVRQHNTILSEGIDYIVNENSIIITVPFKNGRIQVLNK